MGSPAHDPARGADRHRVAITGLGFITAFGDRVEDVWSAIREGRSAVGPVRGFEASHFPTRVAGEVLGFDPRKWLEAKTVRRTGRATQFALAAAAEAMQDAGWIGRLDRFGDGAATIVGTGYGSMPSIEDAYRVYYTEGWRKNSFLTVPICMANAAGSQVAMDFGLKGPSYTISVACASGAAAIGETARMIRSGAVRRAVTGGFEAVLMPGIFSIWCLLGVMSKRNHDPAGACAPFSADRDGLVLGEGACLMTLERLEDALARGAKVYAEVAGVGSNCGAESITAPDLEGEIAAIKAALDDAGVAPEEVGYINAHGTATRLNDPMETRAIQEVFGEHARRLAVSSTKSQLGHTMGASSAIECAVSALALRDGILPPTINRRQPDPECSLDYVTGGSRQASLEVALSNSFAFGGSNVILALRRVAG